MASYSEHAAAIKAAIKAAQDDGHKVLTDLTYDHRDDMVNLIQLDLWDKGEQEYVTVFEEDWR